tara:strand:- start:71082 stop:72326 length:1245 start_codon:yes stop_codon:yes gene_type:complete
MTTVSDKMASKGTGKLVLSYPHEVDNPQNTEDPMYVHSVIFQILVREKSPSRSGSTAGGQAIEVSNGSDNLPIESNMIQNQAIVVAGAAAIAAAGSNPGTTVAVGAGAAIAGMVDKLFGSGDGVQAVIDTTESKVQELSKKVSDYAGSINPIIRTEKIIKLYTPQSPQEEYGAGWTDVEFGLAGALAKQGNVLDTLKGMANGSNPEARERGIRLLTGMSNITQAAGFDFKLQDAIELQTGKIPNPYKQQLFKGMNFRSFAYTFKFIPKNQAELASTYEIIKTFRDHMHPERTDDFFIMYPSTFEIEYQYRGIRNKWLTKIADCALVNMKVDYGAGGALTTFQNTGGAPTEINIEMQFRELALITREHFNDWDPLPDNISPTPTEPVDQGDNQTAEDAKEDQQKQDEGNIKGVTT